LSPACAADVLRTVKLESSITTTCEPSVLVTWTSYAALAFGLSVSVEARVTVPPGTAAIAAAEAEDSSVPVSAVSLDCVDVDEVEAEFVILCVV
jgi:S-methylmethionine-dependent homocysteine/selenocysteine methylase